MLKADTPPGEVDIGFIEFLLTYFKDFSIRKLFYGSSCLLIPFPLAGSKVELNDKGADFLHKRELG